MFHRSLLKSYLVALLILVLCLLPGQSFPKVNAPVIALDKLIHLIMYIPLAWTLLYGFKTQNRYEGLQRKAVMYALLVASVYGGIVELLQLFVSSDRFAEWLDLVADIAGVLLGILTYRWGEKLILWWNRLFFRE